MRSVRVTTRETGTVPGTTRRPHLSLAIISVTIHLRIQVFWVISVYFNARNILPKSGTFPLGTPCIKIHFVPHGEHACVFFRKQVNVLQGKKFAVNCESDTQRMEYTVWVKERYFMLIWRCVYLFSDRQSSSRVFLENLIVPQLVKKFRRRLQNPKVHYHAQKSPPLVAILTDITLCPNQFHQDPF